MNDTYRRMLLSPQQKNAVVHLDDHGVSDPVSLFVMDFATWQMLKPYNFFNYFAKEGTVASYNRYKPVWQRFVLLYPIEARVLQGIYDTLDGDAERILSSAKLSRRFYDAYVEMSELVDELDALVDTDLRYLGKWNHGYVINDKIVA